MVRRQTVTLLGKPVLVRFQLLSKTFIQALQFYQEGLRTHNLVTASSNLAKANPKRLV